MVVVHTDSLAIAVAANAISRLILPVNPDGGLLLVDGRFAGTQQHHRDRAEQQQRLEVIAAFADGERVDTRALRDALADEAGRDYLIDLVALRGIDIRQLGSRPPRRSASLCRPHFSSAPTR